MTRSVSAAAGGFKRCSSERNEFKIKLDMIRIENDESSITVTFIITRTDVPNPVHYVAWLRDIPYHHDLNEVRRQARATLESKLHHLQMIIKNEGKTLKVSDR